MILTYRFRLKDKCSSRLAAQAKSINLVWNYCNETQQKAAQSGRRWLTGYDLWKLVAGVTKCGLDLHSHSAMRACLEYDKSRRAGNKPWLKWRSRRSLGWVPFNTGHVQLRAGAFLFKGELYEAWLHRPLPAGARIGAGSFSQDRRGRWYINCPVELPEGSEARRACVGIDLGLKTLASLSNGDKIEMPAFYRRSEERIAKLQRARKTKRVRAIHAKITNRRKDFLHKASARLAHEYGLIIVGDVSSSKLARTRMAKSVLDAGWSNFKQMLSWKLRLRSGGALIEVPEQFTSQVCSACGNLPLSRPRGIAGLSKRVWRCDDCGTEHDRDCNAARNILRVGLDTLREQEPRHHSGAATQSSELRTLATKDERHEG